MAYPNVMTILLATIVLLWPMVCVAGTCPPACSGCLCCNNCTNCPDDSSTWSKGPCTLPEPRYCYKRKTKNSADGSFVTDAGCVGNFFGVLAENKEKDKDKAEDLEAVVNELDFNGSKTPVVEKTWFLCKNSKSVPCNNANRLRGGMTNWKSTPFILTWSAFLIVVCWWKMMRDL